MKMLNHRSDAPRAGLSRRAVFRFAILFALISGGLVHAGVGDPEPALGAIDVPVTNPPPVGAQSAGPSVEAGTVNTNTAPVKPLSALVEGVIKMADAGISPSVMRTFIESTPPDGPLNEQEVIALKQHDVSDDIVTLLLQTGAERRDSQQQQRNLAIARVLAARRSVTGGLDPESYEYFQRHYLQPRAEAATLRRLAPWTGPRRFHPYGDTPGNGFRHFGRGRGPGR